MKPYDPGRPAEIRVEFTTPDRLVEYRNRRGTEQVDDHTLVVAWRGLVDGLVAVLLLGTTTSKSKRVRDASRERTRAWHRYVLTTPVPGR